LQAKTVLKDLVGVFDEMDFPDESELIALEELGDSLKPLEGLTMRLCTEQFTALQADKVFNIAFDALHRQQTLISDKILNALRSRYEQRKNILLLSALSFLTDPMAYESSNEGLLELCELRMEMRNLANRLFPDPEPASESLEPSTFGDPRPGTSGDPGPGTSGDPGPGTSGEAVQASTELPQLSYGEKLSAMFDDGLKTIGSQKKRKVCDIYADMTLATQTGELTDRLVKLRKALESVQATSVESERAFSIAGRFVTKVKNRMRDNTLDNYCFARHQLRNQMTKKLVAIIFLCMKIYF
jgi:hAT family C-terminal dimerisation region